jgi:diguanylate cyclase (GGDEF)-like protein/PAS domain S-box-containing protein
LTHDSAWNDARRRHGRQGRIAMAASLTVMVAGVALAGVIAVGYREANVRTADARFRAVVEAQPDRLRATLDRYVAVLAVTRGFVASTDDLRAGSFEAFSRSLGLDERTPAIESLMFVRYLPPDGEGATEVPPGTVDAVSYPVVFVAPRTAAPGLLGNDLAGDTSAREALEEVGTRGGVALTPPAPDPWARQRMLIVAPVRRGGGFVGWVGASLDPGELARESLEGLPAGVRGSLAWDLDPFGLALVGPRGAHLTGLEDRSVVSASGATWTIELAATRTFAPTAVGFPWWVFAAALVPAVFTALLLLFLGRSRVRALILAERLARDLEASEARAQAVMDSAVEAIVTADGSGAIETANPAAQELFGWTPTELRGMPLDAVLPGLALDGDDRPGGTRERMVQAHRKDGDSLPVDVTVAPTAVGDRPMSIVIARDATLRKLHEEQLTHQATHDPLTGLANRKLFEELLVRAVFRGERAHTPVAVLFVDLDGFKDVNDAFGHQAGDRVLAETGRRLETAVRPGDLVSRLGGDEFAVICESLASVSDAEKIAGRIVEAVCRGIPVASGVATVTVSVGVAVARPAEGAASLLDRADAAMYLMKREGKAGYRLADASSP